MIFHAVSTLPCLMTIKKDLILFASLNETQPAVSENASLLSYQQQMDAAIAASLGQHSQIPPEIASQMRRHKRIENERALIAQQDEEYRQALLQDQLQNKEIMD